MLLQVFSQFNRNGYPLLDRDWVLSRAEQLLHPVRNVLLLHLREMVLMLLEKNALGNINQVNKGLRLAEAISASYEFFGVRCAKYAEVCAKSGRLCASIRRHALALAWYERAQNLWQALLYPEHRVVTQLQQKIDQVEKVVTKGPN